MTSVKILELTEENTCKLCNNAFGKYSCPKCGILYCSIECYQAETHLECSEKFYRDSVIENLPPETDQESKTKMLDILKRMHEENTAEEDDSELDSDDDVDEEYLELGERLTGINLDDTEKVWEKLTESERKDFEAFLKSESVSQLIERWKPWWLYRCTNKVLDVEKFVEHKNICPKIKGNIKNFNEISKRAISDKVQYNLINIIAAYVLTLRYFNGEYKDFVWETVSCISKISLNLSQNLNFDNFEEAVSSVEMQCTNLNWLFLDAENIKLMKDDVHMIMQGPHLLEKKFYILCSLSELHDLFSSGLKADETIKQGEFSKAFPESTFPQSELESKTSLKHSIKKLEFFLSFVNDVLYL